MALFSKGPAGTGWLTSKETSCQFVQSTCIKLKESAQHKPSTGKMGGGGWKNIEKSKNEQNFCYCIWKWQAWQGRAQGAWSGALNCRAHACDCTLSAPLVLFLVFCLFGPCNLRPSSCPIFFFGFFYCFFLFFCSGNGNWMVKFRKMQFERTPETRDETATTSGTTIDITTSLRVHLYLSIYLSIFRDAIQSRRFVP